MMKVPLTTLLDEQAWYEVLLHVFHPSGLACPHGHVLLVELAPHDRHRAPILDYRCRMSGAVFNLFTNMLFSKTRYRCSTIVLQLRGIAQGTPNKHPADELGIDRGHLLERRHDIQAVLARRLSPLGRLSDAVNEADELGENAGEKGRKPRSNRPTPPACQSSVWSWHLGERSAADRRGGWPQQRTHPLAGL